jgi:2-hydroxy-3-oxopropionate reductase
MLDTVGFIGLGLMGKPMARNLLTRGYPVVVHSRSPGPVEELVAAGAVRASSPADVARQARRIITMLPDTPDVEEVLGGRDGVFPAMQPGTIVIDSSSISPAVTRTLAETARATGGTLLDAPVSGGEIGAVAGTLSIMVGGDAAAFAEVRPILEAMGNPERIILVGGSGAGQTCKVCNQMVIGGTLAVVSEAFALARKADVDPAKVREALLGGFAASRVLEVHGERILNGNYKPGFRAELYAKDYRVAGETLEAHGLRAPVTSEVHGLVNALIQSGRGNDDYSALATVIFDMAGLSHPLSSS